MRKQVYEIDKDGFIKETYVAEVDDNGIIIEEDKVGFISINPPNGLYKAKWTGTEWIEGATQEEIDEITKVEPQPPNQEERIKELETIVNLLLMGGL